MKRFEIKAFSLEEAKAKAAELGALAYLPVLE